MYMCGLFFTILMFVLIINKTRYANNVYNAMFIHALIKLTNWKYTSLTNKGELSVRKKEIMKQFLIMS